MSEMVEKVAGALAERFKATVAGMAGAEFGATGVSLPKEDVWLAYAQAAIEAMREPTDAMAVAVGVQYGSAFQDGWYKMIDAALTPSAAPSPIPGPSENTGNTSAQPQGE